MVMMCVASACDISLETTWHCIESKTWTSRLSEPSLLRYSHNTKQRRLIHMIFKSCDYSDDGIVTFEDIKESGCLNSCMYRMMIQKKLCS